MKTYTPTNPKMETIFVSDDDEITKKAIMELCIRENFYVEDIYAHLYKDLYPPTKKRITEKGIPIELFRMSVFDRMNDMTICTNATILDNKVVGFCMFTLQYGCKAFDLSFLFVKKEHRGNGIATSLINDFLVIYKIQKKKYAGKINYVFVAIKKEMVAFYKRFGFTENKPDDYKLRHVPNHIYLYYV